MFLLTIWFFVAAFIACILVIVRWRHRNNNRLFLKLFTTVAMPLCRLKMQLEGREHLERSEPAVYVMNHQSQFDALTFGNVRVRNDIVFGKKELIWVPFFGFAFWAAGNILLDRASQRKSVAQIDAGVKAIKERGFSISIFPEGTRNHGDGLLPFKKGAFLMAARAGVPIIPIVFSSLKGVANWHEKKIGGMIYARALPPLDTSDWHPHDIGPKSKEVRKIMLGAFEELTAKL